MGLTRANAWAYEGAFIFGGALIVALLQLISSATLDSLLWLYSAAEVAFFYLEFLLMEGNETMLSGMMRLIFIGMDLFWLLVALIPLIVNLVWLIPEKMRKFLINFFLPDTKGWWQSNMSYFEHVPLMTNLHVVILLIIRLSLNLVYGSVLLMLALYDFLDGIAHGGGGGGQGGGGGGGGGGRRRGGN